MQTKNTVSENGYFLSLHDGFQLLFDMNDLCSVKSGINPLPDNKILNCSKFKQIADDILKCI